MRCLVRECRAKVRGHKDPAKPQLCTKHELEFMASPFARRWDPLIAPTRSGAALVAWARIREKERAVIEERERAERERAERVEREAKEP